MAQSDDRRATLEQAATLVKAKQLQAARDLLKGLLKQNPRDPDAWYLSSFTTSRPEEQIEALQRALRAAPVHQAAQRRLEKLQNQTPSLTSPSNAQAASTNPSDSANVAAQKVKRTVRLSRPIMLGVVGLVIVIIVAGLVVLRGGQNLGPLDTTRRFVDAVRVGDNATVKTLFSEAARSQVPPFCGDNLTGCLTSGSTFVQSPSYAATLMSQTDTDAVVQVSAQYSILGVAGTYCQDIVLQRTSGNWQIATLRTPHQCGTSAAIAVNPTQTVVQSAIPETATETSQQITTAIAPTTLAPATSVALTTPASTQVVAEFPTGPSGPEQTIVVGMMNLKNQQELTLTGIAATRTADFNTASAEIAATKGFVVTTKAASVVTTAGATVGATATHAAKAEAGASQTAAAQAFISQLHGKIAFAHGNLYVMNADGSSLHALPLAGKNPAWSPNGLQLLFEGNDALLYIANADGSNAHKVPLALKDARAFTEPAWSPDGKQLVFVADVHGKQLYIANMDGSRIRQVTQDKTPPNSPSWSPDGKRIAFSSNSLIYIVDTDGSHQHLLLPTGQTGYYPRWSPDGQQIVFEAIDASGYNGVYIINSDGTHWQRLSTKEIKAGRPVWSPDGGAVVIAAAMNGLIWQVYAISPDGYTIVQLSETENDNSSLSWTR